MKKVFLIVAAAAVMLTTGFTACKSNSPQPPEPPKEVDVYVANYDNSGAAKVAKVWKNGKDLYSLTNGTNNAAASSVFVVGEDVYTAGWESNGTEDVAKVWKNGEELYALTDGSKYANAESIFVADDKVYTTGYNDTVRDAFSNMFRNCFSSTP